MILGLFKQRAGQAQAPTAAEAAYARIVAQARQPAFYRDLGVPDTVIGRFEMIALHAFLYLHRLKGSGSSTGEVSQETVDLMFRDIDASLREIGVGDLTVPKRMKKLAGSFYARVQVYEAALHDDDANALSAALARNVYGADPGVAPPGASRLATYVRRAAAALKAQPEMTLTTAGPLFPTVEEAGA